MKDFKIYLFVASALLLVYLVAQYNKPAAINWSSSLKPTDKIPFGTYVLYQRLNDVFPGAHISNNRQSIYSLFVNDSLPPGNCIIITHKAKMDSAEFKLMLKYIKAGNSVFIAAFDWGGFLSDTLKLDAKAEFGRKYVGINFTNSQLKRAEDYHFDEDVSTPYFSGFDTVRATVLGQNDLGHSNFLRYTYGKGSLYVCANPHLFSNYILLDSSGADYAQKALSYLPPRPAMIWDEYENGGSQEDQSPLRVFFANESLRWAYYLSLCCLLIFVLYEVKRRQRIIPIIEPLKNTTLEFVNVVGQVYYEQRNNNNIAAKKILYFFEHLRARYYLKTKVLDAEFVETLSHKTNIDAEFARELVNYINYLNAQNRVTDRELIVLNQLIEQFYTKTE